VSIVCRSSADEEIADPFGVYGGHHLHQLDHWGGQAGKVFSAAILTTEPNELTREVHDRMPVILSRDAESGWLDPANQDAGKLQAMLKPYAAGEMEAVGVNPALNKPSIE
jgi:putative SOS response-associated peptidase YedK